MTAVSNVELGVALGWAALRRSHAAWWARFYRASFLSLTDSRTEAFYWAQVTAAILSSHLIPVHLISSRIIPPHPISAHAGSPRADVQAGERHARDGRRADVRRVRPHGPLVHAVGHLLPALSGPSRGVLEKKQP